jgi:glyoxylase-like metal-dependent hydrolase (beta-lactamase superfamily II)
MSPAPSRRDVLRTLIGSAAGLSLPAGLAPRAIAQSHHSTLTSTRLDDSLILVSGAGGNVVVVTGDDGAVMVNGGLREHAVELSRTVSDLTGGKPVRHLFNTDWHSEHTGSNEMLGLAGAQIIAHENTRQYLGADIFVDWQHRTYKALPKVALPTRTSYNADKMTFGSRRIEFGPLGQAHTDGDIFVFFPDSNVLVTGDVLAVAAYPIADYISGGWLGGLMTATKTLLDLANDQTRVIPGVGPVQTRADLKVQHEMLVTLRERLHQMMRKGMGTNDMLAAGATKEFDQRCGDPALFLSVTYRGMWLHVRELGGIV